MTVFILPHFGVFSDINNFWMFIPNSFYTTYKELNNILEFLFVLNITCIKPFDSFD